MFFRRERPKRWTFAERIDNLRTLGFSSRPESTGVLVTRNGCAALLSDAGEGKVSVGKAGVEAGGEIATLVHGGYQLFWRTPGGRELPALAEQLKALHAFEEDLREGLGLTSLYNLSLGTTCEDHLYDRVEDRDEPRHARPWEIKKTA